ncbi:MAG: GntR family transcriptional regulator [Olegusella sp.]|nr:GntR family transcriptional regulator [Olegusella sp.]
MAGETRLDEESLTPLYQQVMEKIKRGIESGAYATGEKIPSEAELSEMYSVSRITVRRAVEELVEQGLLTKRQGKGTYVITH